MNTNQINSRLPIVVKLQACPEAKHGSDFSSLTLRVYLDYNVSTFPR